MPCAMFGQLKHRLIRLNVYSIESEDRLATFAVTRFLYRTIGDGRNTFDWDYLMGPKPNRANTKTLFGKSVNILFKYEGKMVTNYVPV